MPASPILVLLGLIEIFAGLLIFFRSFPIFEIFLWLGLVYVLKGIWSMASSAAARYYYDWMGAVDLLVAASLLLIYAGYTSGFFLIIALLAIAKGIYTVVLSI
jgi:uncharacterized membrane protein HdeD (DUF308 family)